MAITPAVDTRTLNKLFSDVMDHPATRETVDNIFGSNALFRAITELEDGKRMWTGGARISAKIRLGLDTSAGSYEGYDPLDTTPQENITLGLIRTAEHFGNVTISFRELDQSGGPEGLSGLLVDAIEGALGSVKHDINDAGWRDGTGNLSKDMFGMAGHISSTPGTGTTMGVSRSANTAWRNGATDNLATAANILPDLRALYDGARSGDDVPTLGLGTTGGLNAYEGQLVSTIQMSPIVTEAGPRTGDGGIDFLRFKAMRMVSDENAVGYGGGTGEVIVGINPKWLKIYVHRDADFAPTELVKVDKQTAYVGQIRFHGQLVPLQLRRHFVLFNI